MNKDFSKNQNKIFEVQNLKVEIFMHLIVLRIN